ncbi:hypothetical protein M430DRAFT_21419 [Amorphotheca resinae ATCC 22711]|uniref:Tat pathway signal sequence n=1 Tax=Amorphotheca resinae ATCC 22711 TaxID=857342 RepID=A0A2T3AUL9_AMORE|nr:hypothetical protein M430DRAFT_21419 [Amorphotheca resinae ATCC 22711]PSS12323.1 hypothetical protein M430DRAFT_21419 [Amorphotheca resinae ATCC 22711]
MRESTESESFLKADDVERTAFLEQPGNSKKRLFKPIFLVWVINATLMVAVLALLWERKSAMPTPHFRDQGIYSPAQDEIEYKTVIFSSAFGKHKSKYQGPPTDEVDALWDELYNAVGISRIDKKSAMQLPNRTAPIPGDEDHYIVGLDVFHQLHCLNNLRKLVWPERYQSLEQHAGKPEDYAEHINHLDHCVDTLRQSLMCHSDISTLWWEWIPSSQRTLAHPDTTHTCRNFEKIWQWAADHEMKGDFNSYVHVLEED